MDLLATVRKEGSRGGRTDFKWSDVQNSSHREHYLGHSLMAPVGRWAKNRDLNWYTKANQDGDDREHPAEKAARERKEEIRRIKEAEEDALARALGLPVPDRSNANLQPASDKREVDKVVKDATEADSDVGKGIGYGKSSSAKGGVVHERIEGNANTEDKELQYALKEYRRRHGEDGCRRQRQNRSRSRDRDRRHHISDRGQRPGHRDRSGERRHRRRSRSRSRSSDRKHERRRRHRSRSRSPYRSREQDHRR